MSNKFVPQLTITTTKTITVTETRTYTYQSPRGNEYATGSEDNVRERLELTVSDAIEVAQNNESNTLDLADCWTETDIEEDSDTEVEFDYTLDLEEYSD